MRRVVPVLVMLAAAPGLGAETWVEVKSPAFTVVCESGEKDARRILSQFEQIRAVVKEAFPAATVDPPRPVTVLVVRSDEALGKLVPSARQGAAPQRSGWFLAAPDRNWAAVRTDVSRFDENDDSWDNPYRSLFHDYLHMLLRLNHTQVPLWLEEGMAEFWGNTVADGDKVLVGRSVPSHVWTLRERPPVPLPRLLGLNRGAPEYSEADRATPFFAQSWATVHALTVGLDARQAQIGKLLDLLRAGKTPSEATAEAIGDPGALEREVTGYVGRGLFASRRRAAAPETKPLTVRELTAAEALALRSQLAAAAGSDAEAAALAAESLRADANLPDGHEARAIVAWRAQRRDEARQALERAVPLPGASDFAHFLLAQLLWDDGKGRALDRIEAELQRAQELNPRFAKAYETLALVKEAKGAAADVTVPLALRASALEPGNLGFRLTVLRLTARSGQVQQARAQGEKVLASVQGDDRKAVEAVIAEISDPKRLPPEAACAGGFGASCAVLGIQYRDGAGVAKDPARAASYFQKGCDGGHAGSCSSLGQAHEDGVGVAKDATRAFALYRKACDGNDRWACTRLGFALAMGQGVPQDSAEAVRLLEKSCAAADAMACAKLGAMLRVGEDGVAQDMKRAEGYLRTACEKGSSWGCGELAGFLVARGGNADLQEAARLLEGACEADEATFCAVLAGLLELGRGVPRDDARAATLYRRACERGYEPACGKGGATGR